MVAEIAQKIKAYITRKQWSRRDCCVHNIHTPNAETARELERDLAAIAGGQGISPGFTTAEDAIAWLKVNRIL